MCCTMRIQFFPGRNCAVVPVSLRSRIMEEVHSLVVTLGNGSYMIV